MEQKVGVAKSQMLAKYAGVTSLDRVGAREVINTVFPDAPEEEIARAVLLCVNYQLNPLMNHVYLIPFQRREGGRVVGTDWATIIGRGAKRLMASRRGPYSYIENTPRVMTKEEQIATFGEYDEDKLYCITKLQDPKTGATAVGYGFWPKTKPAYNKPSERVPNQPKGTDKGNSMFNMAAGRSETQALDRLRPGEMPMNLPVMDEALAAEAMGGKLASEDYIESQETIVTSTDEVPTDKVEEKEKPVEGEFREVKEEKVEAEPTPEPQPEATEPTPAPSSESASGNLFPDSIIHMDWLNESLATLREKDEKSYSDESLLSYMRLAYKGVEGETVYEIASKLDQGKAAHFTKTIQDALNK